MDPFFPGSRPSRWVAAAASDGDVPADAGGDGDPADAIRTTATQPEGPLLPAWMAICDFEGFCFGGRPRSGVRDGGCIVFHMYFNTKGGVLSPSLVAQSKAGASWDGGEIRGFMSLSSSVYFNGLRAVLCFGMDWSDPLPGIPPAGTF